MLKQGKFFLLQDNDFATLPNFIDNNLVFFIGAIPITTIINILTLSVAVTHKSYYNYFRRAMTKRNDLDFLLMSPKNVETERQSARREAFQQMAQVLQNKQPYSPNQLIESTQHTTKVKSKSTAC